jgi:hypothetical protein
MIDLVSTDHAMRNAQSGTAGCGADAAGPVEVLRVVPRGSVCR